MSRTAKQEMGRWAEDQAAEHLCRRGLKLIARNFACRFGEVDLILRGDDVIVFVEVRARRKMTFMTPAASIDTHKQRRLALTAAHFLKTRPRYRDLPARLDVVSITGPHSQARLEWIKNAFLLDDCAGY